MYRHQFFKSKEEFEALPDYPEKNWDLFYLSRKMWDIKDVECYGKKLIESESDELKKRVYQAIIDFFTFKEEDCIKAAQELVKEYLSAPDKQKFQFYDFFSFTLCCIYKYIVFFDINDKTDFLDHAEKNVFELYPNVTQKDKQEKAKIITKIIRIYRSVDHTRFKRALDLQEKQKPLLSEVEDPIVRETIRLASDKYIKNGAQLPEFLRKACLKEIEDFETEHGVIVMIKSQKNIEPVVKKYGSNLVYKLLGMKLGLYSSKSRAKLCKESHEKGQEAKKKGENAEGQIDFKEMSLKVMDGSLEMKSYFLHLMEMALGRLELKSVRDEIEASRAKTDFTNFLENCFIDENRKSLLLGDKKIE